MLTLLVFALVLWCFFYGGMRYERRMSRRQWGELRLMKRSGDPSGAYVETRDWGRRNDMGTTYRYEVRVHNQDCEVIESRRYLDPEKALEFHEGRVSGTEALQR